MTAKHTPGPWEYVENGKGYTIQGTLKKYKRYIASTCTYGTPSIKENWDIENARLIASAPELFQALKSMIKFAEGNPDLPGEIVLKQAKQALAKAEEE